VRDLPQSQKGNSYILPVNKLSIAEIGCGTGTFSLIFALIEASVTLLDFNENVLQNAKKIYQMYGCDAHCIKANCLDSPMDNLKGSFNIVISSGLAEHFKGKDREKCISYHKELLCKGGFTSIGVPNKLSFFYWMVRLFRQLTGTWSISQEIPFMDTELKNIATTVGFTESYVIGNVGLAKDARVYSRGLISAIVCMLPKSLQNRLRAWKNKVRKNIVKEQKTDDIAHIKNMFEKSKSWYKCDSLADKFSAGIILFGFN